jgi:DNA-binding transcriptional ArsR family regulator
MHVMDLTRTAPRLRVDVRCSTANEFLLTLSKYTWTEDRGTFEEGESWFEEIRTQISPELKAALDRLAGERDPWTSLTGYVWEPTPLADAAALIARLDGIEPVALWLTVNGYRVLPIREEIGPSLFLSAARDEPGAREEFARRAAHVKGEEKWKPLMVEPDELKADIIDVLRLWQAEVFAAREAGAAAVLERDTAAKNDLLTKLSPEEVIETATSGLEYTPEPWVRRFLLTPHITFRPWNIMNSHDDLFMVCYSVADETLGIDVTAPPARLVRLHKALGDEKRLRMLKVLAKRSATLQELADAVGLAKSSAHHHTVILRSAGLVRVTLEESSRYSLRREFIPEASGMLGDFLEGRSS